jgi:uncharacterized membrane protein
MRQIAWLIIGLIERRMWFILPLGVSLIAMLFMGYGRSWAAVLGSLFIAFMMALFWALSWFWLRFFRGLVENSEADHARQ